MLQGVIYHHTRRLRSEDSSVKGLVDFKPTEESVPPQDVIYRQALPTTNPVHLHPLVWYSFNT
jgi:hypothetical protein